MHNLQFYSESCLQRPFFCYIPKALRCTNSFSLDVTTIKYTVIQCKQTQSKDHAVYLALLCSNEDNNLPIKPFEDSSMRNSSKQETVSFG